MYFGNNFLFWKQKLFTYMLQKHVYFNALATIDINDWNNCRLEINIFQISIVFVYYFKCRQFGESAKKMKIKIRITNLIYVTTKKLFTNLFSG